MSPIKETQKIAKLFAKKGTDVIYECEFEGYSAFYEHDKRDDGAFVGYPSYILVNEKLECRYADPDEVLKIL